MKPHYEEATKKEFFQTMVAKGKLPKLVTDASERFEGAYHDTAPRIFPGPTGMHSVMTNMLRDSEKRIDAAHKSAASTHATAHAARPDDLRPASSQSGQAQQLAGLAASGEEYDRRRKHQELKARLAQLEQLTQAERQARVAAEAQLVRAQLASAGQQGQQQQQGAHSKR